MIRIGVLVLLIFQTACAFQSDTSAAVQEGRSRCTSWRIPAAWRAPAGATAAEITFLLSRKYFLRWKDDTRKILMISLSFPNSDVDGDSPSSNHYQIDVLKPAKVSAVADEIWKRGIPLEVESVSGPKLSSFEPVPGETSVDPQYPLPYENHTFAKLGQHWNGNSPTKIAPGRRYIAIESFDGWFVADGRSAPSGTFYVEIRRVLDEKRLVLITSVRL